MTLPKIDLPIYTVRLPSTGQEVRIRPFMVKEEKLLLMAAESGDEQDIISTTKQVITNCLIDDDLNVDKLPFFDIDYLFISLRAKSIGESIEIQFTCKNEIEGRTCGHIFDADVDISKASVDIDETIGTTISLSDKITVKMKYPSYSVMKTINSKDNNIDRLIKILVSSIDIIMDGDKVHSSKDYSREELVSFIEQLPDQQFKKMSKFAENLPSFSIKFDAECTKCKFVHNIKYDDFTSFF